MPGSQAAVVGPTFEQSERCLALQACCLGKSLLALHESLGNRFSGMGVGFGKIPPHHGMQGWRRLQDLELRFLEPGSTGS